MSEQRYLLAIDNGTQSVRALLFDLAGNLVGKGKVELEPYYSEHPGWAEQDPEYYWRSLGEACRQLWASVDIDKSQIAGVSLTTQRGTLINVDAAGQPLRLLGVHLKSGCFDKADPTPTCSTVFKQADVLKWWVAEREADPSVPDGCYGVVDGALWYREGDTMRLYGGPKSQEARIRALAGLRDLGREYLALQSAGADDEPIESARTAFKAAYERLVEKHGRLNDKPNVIAMRGDAYAPLFTDSSDFSPEMLASATGLALWSANRSPLSPGMATTGVGAGRASCNARARPLKPYFS